MATIYKQGVNYIDVLLIFIVGLLSLFISQSWLNPLADLFFTLTWVCVVIYVIAFATGLFKNLILRTPTWTITGLLSIPLWLLVALIPIPSSTGLSLDSQSALVNLFGENLVNFFTQGIYIPIIETIVVVGFIVVFFLRQNNKDTSRIITGFGKNKQTDKRYGLVLIFIALFGALIHYSVGVKLLDVGIGFDFYLLHQILSWFIFAFIALSPLGLGGAIASHIVKNSLVEISTGSPVTYLIVTFAVFVMLDVIAVRTNKGEDTHKRVLKSTGLGV